MTSSPATTAATCARSMCPSITPARSSGDVVLSAAAEGGGGLRQRRCRRRWRPQVIEALGCEVIAAVLRGRRQLPQPPPGPGRAGEPGGPDRQRSKSTGADLGLAFDGDGDRLGVVTRCRRDHLPRPPADAVRPRRAVSAIPAPTVIFDVKCTRRLTALMQRLRRQPADVEDRPFADQGQDEAKPAPLLAGEMSGHIFFKERWYGFDDGIYTAARLLEILSQEKRSAEEVFADLPDRPVHARKSTSRSATSASRAHGGPAARRPVGQRPTSSPSTACASTTRTAGAWCAPPTPRRCWCCASKPRPPMNCSRIQQVFHAQLKAVAPDLELPF